MSDAELAAALAAEAGRLLVSLRSSGEATGKQLGDEGDRRANDLILGRLRDERPHDAVLSEESADSSARLDADRVWIIDPLDGTREYVIPGRTDWAVHIALWERGREIAAAAVAQPAIGVVRRSDQPMPSVGGRATGPIRIVVSDSRPPSFVDAVAARLDAVVSPMGSAGAKAMAVVDATFDAYVHAGGQWEWDSAAPVGVALASGLSAVRLDGSPLRYNQPHPYLPDFVICRSDLVAEILRAIHAVDPAYSAHSRSKPLD